MDGKEVVFTDRQLTEDVTEIRYNKIEIPRGGEYKITLGDGTRVYLNAQTELVSRKVLLIVNNV